ncbi:MAG: hypothetical protein M0Q26_15315 [Chitinophagaceae bacterium]|nr:hypothetical protein [Chitinophagaceae bacterium]
MKTIQILFIVITTTCFTIISCKKSVNQLSLLPPITNTGANTFGCLVNGVAMLPKSGSPTWSNPFPLPALYTEFREEVRIKTGGGSNSPATFICLYLYNLFSNGATNYEWKQTEYGREAFPLYNSQLYGVFIDPQTNKYEWYGSYIGSGSTSITKFDTVNNTISGIFNGRLKQRFGNDTITVDNGRFDINWKTVADKKFP